MTTLINGKEIAENLRNELKQEIDNLKTHKSKKGKTAAIFRIKENIVGNENGSANPTSMKHFKTNEQLFNYEEMINYK